MLFYQRFDLEIPVFRNIDADAEVQLVGAEPVQQFLAVLFLQ